MKSDLDLLMIEHELDALFVSGGTRDNPAMHYLTNGAQVGEYTLLIKKHGEDPVHEMKFPELHYQLLPF